MATSTTILNPVAASTTMLHLSSAPYPRRPSAASAGSLLHFGSSICRLSARPRTRRVAPPAFGMLSPRCGAVTTIRQSEFPAEVLASEVPVLVEFVADWCGPCRLISPVIEWASQEFAGRLKVVKIDHDANPELIQEYKVYGLPSLILFKNGQEVPDSRREGAVTKVKLKEYLDSLLESTNKV